MSIYRSYVSYYREDGTDIESRSVVAVETWCDIHDTEPQTIAYLTRDAKRVGRALWPKDAHRMALDIVRHAPDRIVYEEKGITRGKHGKA